MKVFVHGVPDTGYMWTPLVQALGLGAQEVRTPTLPGFDGTLPEGFPATAPAYVGWVGDLLTETAAWHGPVDLVGHDWGAPISAMAAQMHPGTIRSWTVINAAPEPSYRWHALARKWQSPLLGEILMVLSAKGHLRRQLASAGMPREIADHEARHIDATMKRAILSLYRSARRPADWTMDFSAIAGRGLVLWGENDPFVPLPVARRFSERWGIPLGVEEGVGHWGVCERPDAFARRLAAHWAGQAAPDPTLS